MKLANGIIILAAITMGTLAACDSTVTEGPETPQRPAVTPQVGSTCSNLDYSGTYGVSLSTESHDLCWDFVTDVIELEVGRHEIAAVSSAGAPRTASIQILPGSTRSLLELLPPPPTPARVTPTGTWVLVAVGGAAAATGVALLALAEERRSELSNTSTDDEGNVTSITEQRAHDIRDEVAKQLGEEALQKHLPWVGPSVSITPGAEKGSLRSYSASVRVARKESEFARGSLRVTLSSRDAAGSAVLTPKSPWAALCDAADQPVYLPSDQNELDKIALHLVERNIDNG